MCELFPLLRGWSLRDLAALPPRDLLLVFEPDAAGGAGAQAAPVRRLRISADPDASRLHLQHGRARRGKGPPGPFYRRLERELAGARLAALEQVRGDRIVLLELRDAPAGARRALLCELTGRHANLVLLGPGDRVLDLLVPAPTRRAEPRLVVGEPWRAPPGRAPAPGGGRALADAFAPPPDPPPIAAAPLSWRVERALGAEVCARDLEAERKRLKRRAERKLAKARGLLRGLERRLASCDQAERARRDGELLTAHLSELRRGMESVELADWHADGAPRRIELDPRRGPRENAERLFERYRELGRVRAGLPDEIARARRRAAALEELLARCADPAVDPAALDGEAVARGLLDPRQEADERKRKEPGPRLPYRSFSGSRGSEIRVGRSARDNDALTFRHARGNDLWLHTAEAPGSHVVLCGAGRGEPDPEEVLDAAHLAVHFSPLRGAARADVHVAQRKLVHKPRGAKPGLVTLSGGRNLRLRVQPERLARLLARGRSLDPDPDPDSEPDSEPELG